MRRGASYLFRQDTDEQLAELESESHSGSSEESDEDNQAGGTVNLSSGTPNLKI